MSQPEAPKIEFPCPNYPIKVVGKREADYDDVILKVIQEFAPDCTQQQMKSRDSKQGRYRAITVYVYATGIEQLQAIHKALSAHPYVHMVI